MRSACVTSLRTSRTSPGEQAVTLPAPGRRVNHGGRKGLDDDAEREVKRAARADERARELQVGSGVDEDPRVLGFEAEEPELVEAPTDDALILERSLEGLRWVFRCRHTG